MWQLRNSEWESFTGKLKDKCCSPNVEKERDIYPEEIKFSPGSQ